MNLPGILGWFLNGRVLRRQLLPRPQLALFNVLAPIFERLETAVIADHRSKLGRDEHLAAQGLTQGLDARNLVDRRPDYREVEAVDGADIAIEHLPEMEREVDRGNWLAGLVPGGIEPIEAIHRFRRRIEGVAAGFIPRRIHEGKDREHAVAHEPVHIAVLSEGGVREACQVSKDPADRCQSRPLWPANRC